MASAVPLSGLSFLERTLLPDRARDYAAQALALGVTVDELFRRPVMLAELLALNDEVLHWDDDAELIATLRGMAEEFLRELREDRA
jgi:hypothetical protein